MPDRSYNLGRHHVASARLNLQHWLLNLRQGYLLHPSIQLGDTAAVADIGTGTGAWLFELADKSPSTCTFDGIDIDLSQFPHEKWLPQNVRSLELDLYNPVPASLLQKYDLVHIRAFSVNFRNQDPTFLLEQFKLMVKDGGWIQWTEADLCNDKVVKASNDIKSVGFERLWGSLLKLLEPRLGSSPGWASRLPAIFGSSQLAEVTIEHTVSAPHLRPSDQDNHMLGWQELVDSAPDSAELQAQYDEALAEYVASGRGLATEGRLITLVGRVVRS